MHKIALFRCLISFQVTLIKAFLMINCLYSFIAQLSTALRCYNGLVQRGKELSGIRAVDCPYGTDQCATISYSVKVLGLEINSIQGMCTNKLIKCQLCSVMRKNSPVIENCDVSQVLFIGLKQMFPFKNASK